MSTAVLAEETRLERCGWFTTCDRWAAHVIDHPVLGLTRCCSRCARTVGIELPPPPEDTVGWRMTIHYRTRTGVPRFTRAHFFSPDIDTVAVNVCINFNIWHERQGDVIEYVVRNSAIARGTTGWGQGAWLDTFKRGAVDGDR